MTRKRAKHEPHVRLYAYELRSEAYRSLSTDARALLVEFRALYRGQENRIFMSVREMMKRLGVGQRRATRARDELIDRGFIRLTSKGAFNRKTRHASEYQLLSEVLDNGNPAPKTYLRWKKPVAETTTGGSPSDYRHPKKNVK